MSDTFSTASSTISPRKTIGRFAPSPTGPLHFGSLIAATASYLQVKAHHGDWLLRIEDVDSQREQAGAADAIIHTLAAYGFEWTGEISYQSQREDFYQAALESLHDLVYPCSCTRKALMAHTSSFAYIYPEFCRGGLLNPNADQFSIRLQTDDSPICFDDLCQPQRYCQNIRQTIGDYILKRSDGLWAYQLAVVVDDALQGITEVVRGADLFDNTPRQIYLQRLLGYSTPSYFHFPVVVDNAGKKLSKQNLSAEISADKKRLNLCDALHFLGQAPPPANQFASLDDLWNWAVQNWTPNKVPKVLSKRHERSC